MGSRADGLDVKALANLEDMELQTSHDARFDRIDVSSILGFTFIGVAGTLKTCIPMLKTLYENRHATLAGCIIRAVDRADDMPLSNEVRDEESAHRTLYKPSAKKLLTPLPIVSPCSKNLWLGKEYLEIVALMFRGQDLVLGRYRRYWWLDEATANANATEKIQNILFVPSLRFWIDLNLPQDEIKRLFGLRNGCQCGNERYFE